MIIGCVLGYFVAVTQVNQLIAPEYIAFWTSKNMPVPEPLGFAKSIISFGMLFSGIPTGLIFYSSIAKKWLTPIDNRIYYFSPLYTCWGNWFHSFCHLQRSYSA